MLGKFNFLKLAFSQVGKLSEQEELQLVKQYQRGDMQAFNQLRLSLRPLVEKAIFDVMPGGNTVSASNIRMRADIELPKILQNFDETRGFKLKTFVLSQLKGYLRNAVAENMTGPYVPRNQQPDLNRYRQAIRDAQMEFGRNATEDQIRSFYPEDDATTPFDKIKTYHVNSYLGDAVHNEDDSGEGVVFKDQFTEGDSFEQDDLLSSLYEEEESDIISQNFTPQEQQVIEKVTQEGQPFVQAALSLGLSTSEVRKIMRKWHAVTQKN